LAPIPELAVVNLPPLWTGAMVQPQLQRPESLPDYWAQATSALDAAGTSTRVLEIPGQDFGAYRWGTTQDVITRGLMDRPWVGRELIPFGSPPSADLLRAFDRRVQEGTLEPAAIAPIARLMAAGTVLLRTDAAYERYVTPRPRVLQQLLTPTPSGLSAPITYGPPDPNRAVARQPLVDETELSTDPATAWPAPLAAYAVDAAVPIVHTERADAAVVVVGNGEGLIDAAEAGLAALDDLGSVPVMSAAALDGITVPVASSIVLTDSNRRRAERWGTLRENYGYTETASEEPLVDDPKDTRLDVFPGSTDADRSVTVFSGNIASVRASRYGNPVSYSPEDRPANALDGDLRTAWRTGAFEKVGGERWRVDLTRAVTTDHVTLVQPGGNRFITSVTVELSDGSSTHVPLGDDSFAESGQRIDLGSHTFTWMEIRIDSANIGRRADYLGLSTVGLREVRIDGVGPSDERVQLPGLPAGLDTTGSVDVVLSRLRANPSEAFKSDTETHLSRRFTTPAGDYELTGAVRLNASTPDTALDAIIGRSPDGSTPRATATSSDRLGGMRTASAAAAFDGNSATFWSAGFGPQAGRWIELDAAAPTTVEHVQLTVLADGRHSVPTELKVTGDGGEPIVVPVPEIADGTDENHLVAVDVAITPPITATRLRIEISAVRSRTTKDFLSAGQVEMPVALAEVDLGGVRVPPPSDLIDTGCRNDLLSIAGSPVSVAIRGTTADALAGRQLTLTSCQGPLRVADDAVDLTAAPGIDTGFDIDRVVLHRDATRPTPPSAPVVPVVPTVAVVADGQHSFDLSVTNQPGGGPFWLVLGQSRSDGWELKINGHDLGTPRLVNGYANGWLVDPSKVFDGATVAKASLDWTPQHVVDLAMWFSALAVVVCLGLIVLNPGRAVTIDTSATAPTGRSLLGRHPGRTTRPNATRIALVVAGATLLAWLLGGLVVAIPIALVTALAMTTRWGTLAVAVPPWAFFGP
ncbi:MAG: alpha-(1-_3)-arabinofuranosyltransferase family protein, partial [Acidimicrobiia bacterium]